jgi:hypothetical protein
MWAGICCRSRPATFSGRCCSDACETRALVIAIFYAVGTGAGGIAGPWLLSAFIETGSRQSVFTGYLIGAALMMGAAVIAALWAVDAERKSLEEVSKPLASV